MASRTTTALRDDLDGRPAAETVQYSLDGSHYEIDLSKRNAAALRKALQQFIVDAARPVRTAGNGGRARRRPGRTAKAELDAIRSWAKANGIPIADKGRIAQHTRELYAAR